MLRIVFIQLSLSLFLASSNRVLILPSDHACAPVPYVRALMTEKLHTITAGRGAAALALSASTSSQYVLKAYMAAAKYALKKTGVTASITDDCKKLSTTLDVYLAGEPGVHRYLTRAIYDDFDIVAAVQQVCKDHAPATVLDAGLVKIPGGLVKKATEVAQAARELADTGVIETKRRSLLSAQCEEAFTGAGAQLSEIAQGYAGDRSDVLDSRLASHFDALLTSHAIKCPRHYCDVHGQVQPEILYQRHPLDRNAVVHPDKYVKEIHDSQCDQLTQLARVYGAKSLKLKESKSMEVETDIDVEVARKRSKTANTIDHDCEKSWNVWNGQLPSKVPAHLEDGWYALLGDWQSLVNDRLGGNLDKFSRSYEAAKDWEITEEIKAELSSLPHLPIPVEAQLKRSMSLKSETKMHMEIDFFDEAGEL
jgi:hypothetical protein